MPMKKNITLLLVLALSFTAFSQVDSIQPPYKKFPTYPPVKLLLPDSSNYYTKADLPKKLPIILMLFNPQCEHCQHETRELTKNIDKFKDLYIVMATFAPFDSMMKFRAQYNLASFKNIVVGQDTHYFLPSFFNIRNLPFHAFYNKKKELISAFEGSLPLERILSIYKD